MKSYINQSMDREKKYSYIIKYTSKNKKFKTRNIRVENNGEKFVILENKIELVINNQYIAINVYGTNNPNKFCIIKYVPYFIIKNLRKIAKNLDDYIKNCFDDELKDNELSINDDFTEDVKNYIKSVKLNIWSNKKINKFKKSVELHNIIYFIVFFSCDRKNLYVYKILKKMQKENDDVIKKMEKFNAIIKKKHIITSENINTKITYEDLIISNYTEALYLK
jgi:hypothetical protein